MCTFLESLQDKFTIDIRYGTLTPRHNRSTDERFFRLFVKDETLDVGRPCCHSLHHQEQNGHPKSVNYFHTIYCFLFSTAK